MDTNFKLNPAQQQAADAIEGPVLVFAGAGSGKTRVLTSRIINMVSNHRINPYNILAITFTNKAANEMLNRLNEQLGFVRGMTVCTIHSMCARILRTDGHLLGYTDNFSIYSDTETDKVLKQLFESFDIDEKAAKDAAANISKAKNLAVSVRDFEEVFAGLPHVDILTKVYKAYEAQLKQNNAMDFDDLLLNTLTLFTQQPDILEKYQDKYQYISIDEFQDTNKVQYSIIRLLAAKHKNLFVVGDDDQSIYGWRGADVGNILHLQRDFKDVKIFKLEQNYRSTKKILNAANAVIKANPHRMEKTLWTENGDGIRVETYATSNESEEAMFVVQNIIQLVKQCNYKYSDCAILLRMNALTRTFEHECMKYNVPYKIYGGFKFFQRKEIKDIIAYLRCINNPQDNEAFLRIINFPRRGIGDVTIAKLRDQCFLKGICLRKGICDAEILKTFNKKTADKLLVLAAKFAEFDNIQGVDLVEVTKRTIKIFELGQAFAEDEDTLLNIEQFVLTVAEFAASNMDSSLCDLLQSVLLLSDLDETAANESVTISTVHSSKGLEFKAVFIIGLEEGIFPISRAIFDTTELQEERRLMYVAITRAMQRLYLTYSRSRFMYGDRKDMLASRFYKEVGEINATTFSPETKAQPKSFVHSTINAADIQRGSVVRHKVFGIGKVIDIKNENADIAFANVGVKTLALKFAPLEIIEK